MIVDCYLLPAVTVASELLFPPSRLELEVTHGIQLLYPRFQVPMLGTHSRGDGLGFKPPIWVVQLHQGIPQPVGIGIKLRDCNQRNGSRANQGYMSEEQGLEPLVELLGRALERRAVRIARTLNGAPPLLPSTIPP